VIQNLTFTTDEGVRGNKRIGLVVLASDYTIDYEFRKIFPINGVDFFQARIENSTVITPDTLSEMHGKISSTLKLILPDDTLDVVAYGCTSATVVLGEEKIFSAIQSVHPNAYCTTPITAAFKAFHSMKAKNIAVLTPYRNDVNQLILSYIEKGGFSVSSFGSFNEENDPIVACIDKKSIINGIKEIIKGKNIDMVFVSCTSIKFMECVSELEEIIGIPVTTSNHAMAWHCMRMAEIQDKLPDLGSLYNN